MKMVDVKTNCYTPHPMCYWPSTDFDRVEIRQHVEMGRELNYHLTYLSKTKFSRANQVTWKMTRRVREAMQQAWSRNENDDGDY